MSFKLTNRMIVAKKVEVLYQQICIVVTGEKVGHFRLKGYNKLSNKLASWSGGEGREGGRVCDDQIAVQSTE